MPRFNPLRVVGSLIPEPGLKRSYALATIINTFGSGLLLVSMPLYFTRIVHLSVTQVGLGLTIAATVTLLIGLPIGDLADRRGPLQVATAMLLVQCGATLAFLVVHSFLGFVVIATVDTMAGRAIVTAEGALLRRLAGEDAPGFRSVTHAITNVGFSLGFAGCSVAIQLGTSIAYDVLIVVDALTFLATWAVLRRLPRYEPLPKPAGVRRWGVLRDRPFVAFAVLGAASSLQFSVITLLVPMWVVTQTHAPRWCISLSLVVNTVLVVLFQVRLGGGVQTVRQGGVAWGRAGVFFVLSCSVLAFASGLPSWAALALVVAAVTLHTFGEILHMAAGFALSMGLPPAHAQGQYDGFLSIVGGIGAAAAPALLLGVVLNLGRAGLIGLGVFFVLTFALMPAVARWGERTRPAPPEAAVVQAAAEV
jgi:hypothetical protein